MSAKLGQPGTSCEGFATKAVRTSDMPPLLYLNSFHVRLYLAQ